MGTPAGGPTTPTTVVPFLGITFFLHSSFGSSTVREVYFAGLSKFSFSGASVSFASIVSVISGFYSIVTFYSIVPSNGAGGMALLF